MQDLSTRKRNIILKKFIKIEKKKKTGCIHGVSRRNLKLWRVKTCKTVKKRCRVVPDRTLREKSAFRTRKREIVYSRREYCRNKNLFIHFRTFNIKMVTKMHKYKNNISNIYTNK